MQTTREIRQTFLDFFQQKAHQIVPSAPIVVKNDPTLMFTNAGMNQFKDLFLGLKTPSFRRIADTQKCLRVSGKHNDLEEVGHDTYHHTMFEMLGNWSIGEYYKAEAIEWAWELLTAHYGIDPARMYATVFGGDEAEGLPADEEAVAFWRRYLPEDHILYCGKKDNFWEMGDTGPCGPCSEIHVDLRSDEARALSPGSALVNQGTPEVIEIWNLVFIQFNRRADSSLEDLPEKHVDTGMGFERLCMVLQGKHSTYDTDLFDPARTYLEAKTRIRYADAPHMQQVAMRVVMDHIRAIVFTIGDGQLPSNTGAGYVIRRILRRASRYAFSYLGLHTPFLHELVPVLAQVYKGVFTEVGAQEAFIARIILEEEKGFLSKLEKGSQMFDAWLSEHRGAARIDGQFAFKLYDTFGFPIDLTRLMAQERGLEVDMAAFETLLQEQKTRSREATEVNTGDWIVVHPSPDLPRFVGYDTLAMQTRIRQYRTIRRQNKAEYHIVLEETPFYAESGGQTGDRGLLRSSLESIRVLDTKKENELIVHTVDRLPQEADGEWHAEVDAQTRHRTSQNHSATHLVHAALRQVLGSHVEQRGSLVSESVLRFDFSHFARVSDEELTQVEAIVNERIAADIPLTEYREMPIAAARAMGAMALFGEKYGEQVRVIVFDSAFSVELCGGTHVPRTSQIRLFKFVSEGSVAAGVRRIEAYTGEQAAAYLNSQLALVQRLSEKLKQPASLEKALDDLLERNRQLEKELAQLNSEKLAALRETLAGAFETRGELQLLRRIVQVGSTDDLKQLSFDLKRSAEGRALIVLGAVIGGKPQLSVILSDSLAAENRYHAGHLVRELAKPIQGGGGGQPFYATAGGKDPARLQEAVDKIEELL